jgi:hypothetical protein
VSLNLKRCLSQKKIWVPVLILSLCGSYFVAFETVWYPPLGLLDGCFDCVGVELTKLWDDVREKRLEKELEFYRGNRSSQPDVEYADFNTWTILLGIYVLLLIAVGFFLVAVGRRGRHRLRQIK